MSPGNSKIHQVTLKRCSQNPFDPLNALYKGKSLSLKTSNTCTVTHLIALLFSHCSKRKINDFLTVLEGFNKATEIVTLFKDHVSNFRYVYRRASIPCLAISFRQDFL